MTTLTRRSFIAASGAGAATLAVTGLGTKLVLAAPDNPQTGDTVLVLNLLGGCDGLNLAPPYSLDSYYNLRPNIAVPRPGEPNGALPLNGSTSPNAAFPTGIDNLGLHPACKPIHETLWAQGRLAVLPAIGIPASETSTRSHFSAQDYLQAGTTDRAVSGGWLGRFLNAQNHEAIVPAVIQSPKSKFLSGGSGAVSVPHLTGFGVKGIPNREGSTEALAAMYSGDDTVSAVGRDVLAVAEVVEPIAEQIRPNFPDTKLGQSLAELSAMLKGGIGIQAASLDYGNWDHHQDLGRVGDENGRFTPMVTDLAQSLRAFADDTDQLKEIIVLVITEFGRTIHENSSLGTDHGRAATYLCMGDGIRGGVYGDDFPDVIADDPDEGDLTVLTDYRKPILEICRKRGGVDAADVIFPSYTGDGELGLAV